MWPYLDGGETLLADPLPAEPLPVLRDWLEEAWAKRVQPNPNAMTLATCDAQGRPSARVVLCQELDCERGAALFYTHRESRKGRDLAEQPRAALVFHWDALGRQARLEGPVTQAPDREADAYFARRPFESRLAAFASEQSRPVASRAALVERVVAAAERLGIALDGPRDAVVPRPSLWGGYRVWIERVELWVGRAGRLHDRGAWTRALRETPDGYRGGAWSAERLQP